MYVEKLVCFFAFLSADARRYALDKEDLSWLALHLALLSF
jgi:hypothetical protein